MKADIWTWVDDDSMEFQDRLCQVNSKGAKKREQKKTGSQRFAHPPMATSLGVPKLIRPTAKKGAL